MKNETEAITRLDRAIRELREGSRVPMRLSEPTAAVIRDRIRRQDPPLARLMPVFGHPGRWAAVVAVPMIAWLLAAVWLPGPARTPETVDVFATKNGQQVVFRIANGHPDHRVTKSERPDRFDGSTAVDPTNGAFVDRLDAGSDIVFYRID